MKIIFVLAVLYIGILIGYFKRPVEILKGPLRPVFESIKEKVNLDKDDLYLRYYFYRPNEYEPREFIYVIIKNGITTIY